jgi:hypothetical protein
MDTSGSAKSVHGPHLMSIGAGMDVTLFPGGEYLVCI